ncbi:septum site-determining protein MinC [Clostridiaceae bacterium HSG29]|nr:septum site-determining protein MinC [Clostridiaceae bacterium HSG29]
MKNIINFKGVNEGLILQIDENADFDSIIRALEEKSKQHSSLIKNANLVGTVGKKLNYTEKASLEKILIEIFKINVLTLENFSYNKVVDNNKVKSIENDTVFIENTLRSGNEISSDGNIVVLGDVNPGAVLKAKGNIIVFGKLRGVAYAGLNGDENAFIAANLLVPSQIRIGNIISRAPDNDGVFGELSPEKAYVNADRIEIKKI